MQTRPGGHCAPRAPAALAAHRAWASAGPPCRPQTPRGGDRGTRRAPRAACSPHRAGRRSREASSCSPRRARSASRRPPCTAGAQSRPPTPWRTQWGWSRPWPRRRRRPEPPARPSRAPSAVWPRTSSAGRGWMRGGAGGGAPAHVPSGPTARGGANRGGRGREGERGPTFMFSNVLAACSCFIRVISTICTRVPPVRPLCEEMSPPRPCRGGGARTSLSPASRMPVTTSYIARRRSSDRTCTARGGSAAHALRPEGGKGTERASADVVGSGNHGEDVVRLAPCERVLSATAAWSKRGSVRN